MLLLHSNCGSYFILYIDITTWIMGSDFYSFLQKIVHGSFSLSNVIVHIFADF